MKSLVFCAIFFSGSCIYSMNSTEGRQELAEISSKTPSLVSVPVTLDLLEKESKEGIVSSALAREMYMDFMQGNFPRHIGNAEACRKLVSVGLARYTNSEMRFIEYFVSDELPTLTRASRFNKKGQ